MTKTLSCAAFAALLAGTALVLTGCGGGSAASTAARDHSQAQTADLTTSDASDSGDHDRSQTADRTVADREPVPTVDGAPMWAANKRHTAQENADYQFKRDGADFGAATLQDFIQKAHAFTAKPPKGVLTLTRSNGDKLLYDPRHNIFAVVTKDGAPRAMFKPQSGKAYWDQQVARQSEGDDRSDSSRSYSRRSRDSGDDQG
jgi:pyocin large subunit-like protein